MNKDRTLGMNPDGSNSTRSREEFHRLIEIKLAALGHPIIATTQSSAAAKPLEQPNATLTATSTAESADLLGDLLARHKQYARLLGDYRAPIDARIGTFLNKTLAGLIEPDLIALPKGCLTLDRHGIARALSLPRGRDTFSNDILSSYRVAQGVLHNPKSDRRTTAGVFHVADFDLPVPADKLAAPLVTFARILQAALRPPGDLLRLPYTSDDGAGHELWCALMLRPLVCPQVPGHCEAQSLETRFFAPAGLVCNLDFVESIFGNAGDPYLSENDAGLDVRHWTGHTGCVILAPHVVGMKKKDLGLPHESEATERQKRDGMCWSGEEDIYNEGRAFKITLRSRSGQIVTIIGDNYFGYCKKEVKAQISFSANLRGGAEEEHAGGALAFPSYNHGQHFAIDAKVLAEGHTFGEAVKLLGERAIVHEEGYATDARSERIIYLPETVTIDAQEQLIRWETGGQKRQLPLLPGTDYVLPIGYKLRYERHPNAPSWRLEGTRAEGVVCHKPCTVSGGGKSEISKSIGDAIVYGPIYVQDFEQDMAAIAAVFARDYSTRFREPLPKQLQAKASRGVLAVTRSLGSVIKLLTPSGEFSDAFNDWLGSLPSHLRALIFIIKRFYEPAWGEDWRSHFSVDVVNGKPGHEFKLHGRKLVGSYLRVGFSPDGNWQLFKLRQDFIAASKVQFEDDITASITLPSDAVPNHSPFSVEPSLKVVENCEYRLFQRPDNAVHPGLDRQTELDMSQPGLFGSNYHPLTGTEAKGVVENVVEFEPFTLPMKATLLKAAEHLEGYVICSARPRVVDGKLTKNPRYLQTRPDVSRPMTRTLAQIGAHLHRRVPLSEAVTFPVDAVLCGRRNNPSEPGVRSLAVYNPIHYQELPELFMDFICSLTGKSPSTTGAGSEGALTKGPFNALRSAADLNNALVSYILTGLDGFSTAAGYVGPNCRVDHDVSLLVPEIWCRLRPQERRANYLIENGCLERMSDFNHAGQTVRASRLGYRITGKFVADYLGRLFDDPVSVFPEYMLRPELQSLDEFADGVANIVSAQQRVAQMYFEDGSLEDLCPPLRALVTIMAEGTWDGADESSHKVRAMFTRDALLSSEWYRARLDGQQRCDFDRLVRHRQYVDEHLQAADTSDDLRDDLVAKREWLEESIRRIGDSDYATALVGSIGVEPSLAMPSAD